MKTILAVDSTSEILSVSLSEGLNILSEIKDDKSMKHMVNIMSDIDYVLKKADKAIKEVELFAVNLGPGDFTGGRIGISIVKMFSMLSGKPVLGFNSLDVFSVGAMLKNISIISKNISGFSRLFIMPLMDVRNHEIYGGIYEVDSISNDHNSIFSYVFEDKKYFLNKISGEFLVDSKDFSGKISQVIKHADLIDIDISFLPGQLSEIDRTSKGHNWGQEDSDVAKSVHSKHCFIFSANALTAYRELLENLKSDISINYRNTEIILDDKNINPSSVNINFLADYSYPPYLKQLPIAPIYVRDFIAFSKK